MTGSVLHCCCVMAVGLISIIVKSASALVPGMYFPNYALRHLNVQFGPWFCLVMCDFILVEVCCASVSSEDRASVYHFQLLATVVFG